MSKARQLADLGSVTTRLDEVGNTDGALSNRNLIINGAMQVAQRGTSFTGVVNTIFSLDRFQWQTSTGPTVTIEQSTDAPTGFSNSLKVEVTSTDTMAAGDYDAVYTPIEGLNFSHLGFGSSGAKQFTLSFWAKASLTGTYSVILLNSANDRTWTGSYSVNTASTWEYKTIVVDGDTVGTWLATNGIGLKVWFSLGSGSTYQAPSPSSAWSAGLDLGLTGAVDLRTTSGATWQITGVQLEAGDQSTPFEHRSFGQELALCQRYCQRFGNGENNVLLGMAHTYAGGVSYGVLKYHNTMRTTPSATFSTNDADTWRFRYANGLNANNVAGTTGIGADQFGQDQCRFYISTGTAVNNNGWVRGQTDASYLILEAEL